MNYKEKLKELDELGLRRYLREVNIVQGDLPNGIELDGKRVLNLASNDYLGLSQHPRVRHAAMRAIGTHGFGAGASRLITGTTNLHLELEARLARFKKKDAGIVFGSGYVANLGVIPALVGKGDEVYFDKLSHACLIDGIRLCGAKMRSFPHKSYEQLAALLSKSKGTGKRLIVTDSVFSMDGDVADLVRLVQIKKKHHCLLMLDEAHGTGILGGKGRGLAEALGVESEIDITMGTLSKALGGLGGYVVGSTDQIDYLQNHARTFIYTTALPAAICAGVIEAIDLIDEDEEPRKELASRVEWVRGELGLLSEDEVENQVPILPIRMENIQETLDASDALLRAGFLVAPIRYPTVPKNEPRLRLTVCAHHSWDELKKAMHEIKCLLSSQVG